MKGRGGPLACMFERRATVTWLLQLPIEALSLPSRHFGFMLR